MMSKQIKRGLGLTSLALFVAFSLFSYANPVSAKLQRSGIAAGNPRNAAIIATTKAVLKETSDLRELSILRDVKSGSQSRAEIERMIIKNLDEESTPAEMQASELVLKTFGLAPADFKYRPFLIKLLTEQVAGYYDPKVQQFYLADWIELEGQKPVMAHELTHALQDQHFNLRRFEKWPKGDSDAELAAHALIEGDATLAMTLYMAKNPMVALAFLRSLGSDGIPSEQFKQAPRAIRESLMFPYEQGAAWATQLYRRGGWRMVSQAFTKLPQSTEQILHADKYYSYEPPVKVTLPNLKVVLGPSWKKIDEDVNGEWGYYLILDEFLGSQAESNKAAAGWAGDRYVIYQGDEPGQVLLVQETVWDTDNDVREFFDAYASRVQKRYQDAQPFNDEPKSEMPDRREWKTSSGRVIMEKRGKRVLILEGIPATIDSNALVAAMW